MVSNPRVIEAEIAAEIPYDASDKEVVNKARSKAGRKKREHLETILELMQAPRGREFIYRLLVSCDVYRVPICLHNQRESDFRMGQMYIGHQILADVKAASLDLYTQMLKEAEDMDWKPLYPTDGINL